MRDFGPFQKVARAIAFGRHVPLSSIARRIELDLKRRVKQRGGKPAPAAAPSLSARPPTPLFKPRLGKLDFRDGRPRLTFVGRACEMKEPLDWRAGGEGPANQLWRMNLHYMEYLEEADDSLFADLVRQWIDANPPYARGYWKDSWNSYTVSLRTVVWMQQLALARRAVGRRHARSGGRVAGATNSFPRGQSRDRHRRKPSHQEHQGAAPGLGVLRRFRGRTVARAGASTADRGTSRASLAGWDALRAFAVLPLPGFRRPAGMPAGAWRRSIKRRARRRAGADGAGRGRPRPSRRPRRAFQRRGPFHGLFAGGMP